MTPSILRERVEKATSVLSDEQLVQIASDFRDGILDGAPSDMMCGMVSWPLAAYFGAMGFPVKTVDGDLGHLNHIWIALPDGRVLDATADQFNRMFPAMNLPPVYLGPPLDIHPSALDQLNTAKEPKGE